jgi:hypothetical protein
MSCSLPWRWVCRAVAGGRGSRGWCSRVRAWRVMRRARRCARRRSRGLRRWPCRRRAGGCVRRTGRACDCRRRVRRGRACPAGTVEALPGVGAGGDDEQWRPAGLRLQPGEGRGAVFGAHAAAQHHRIMARGPQPVRQLVQVRDPADEDEAVPALRKRGHHVRDDLADACLAGDQVVVDHRHPAGHGGIGIAGVAVEGGVQVQHWRRPAARGTAWQRRYPGGGLAGSCDGVPDRPRLHRDQTVELVAPVGCGGQPEPAARRPPPSRRGRPRSRDPRRRRPGLRLPRHRPGAARPARDPGPGAERRLGSRQRLHERHRRIPRLAEPGGLGDASGGLRPGE